MYTPKKSLLVATADNVDNYDYKFYSSLPERNYEKAVFFNYSMSIQEGSRKSYTISWEDLFKLAIKNGLNKC
jgi:hypothetical protein